jgi:hypothetical protein
LNKAIATLKQTIKGLNLSTRDVPKMQLKSTINKPFLHEPAYDTVEHFLRALEKTVMSTGKVTDNVWRCYVPVALGDEHHNWLKDTLLTAKTWVEAKQFFIKQFHNAQTILLAML